MVGKVVENFEIGAYCGFKSTIVTKTGEYSRPTTAVVILAIPLVVVSMAENQMFPPNFPNFLFLNFGLIFNYLSFKPINNLFR